MDNFTPLPDISESEKSGLLLGLAWGRRYIPPCVAFDFHMLQFPGSLTRIYYADDGTNPTDDAAPEWARGTGICASRNRMILEALKHKARWVFMHDDDVSLPGNTIRLLHAVMSQHPDVAAVSGIVVQKTADRAPMVWKQIGSGPTWDFKIGEVFEVVGFGAGCLMIDVAACEKVGGPWFANVMSTGGRLGDHELREEFHLAAKLRNGGYRCAAHGGILCGHWDQSGHNFQLMRDTLSEPREGAQAASV